MFQTDSRLILLLTHVNKTEWLTNCETIEGVESTCFAQNEKYI